MKYYPISRVITGSTTSGNQFLLNGKPYVGPYYKTFQNEFFSGNDPVTGKSELLTAIVSGYPSEDIRTPKAGYFRAYSDSAEGYAQAKNFVIPDLETFVPILPYYPKPTDMDYKKGFFFRYFAKQRNENGNLIETTQEVYNSLKEVQSPYNYEMYHAVELYWQLSGPLKDTVNTTNGVRTAGIEDTNKRLVETKDVAFKGLSTFIGGKYGKFAKVST